MPFDVMVELAGVTTPFEYPAGLFLTGFETFLMATASGPPLVGRESNGISLNQRRKSTSLTISRTKSMISVEQRRRSKMQLLPAHLLGGQTIMTCSSQEPIETM